jgi:hypothetical protein
MKTYNNIKEVNKDIKDNVLEVDDDIEIAFDGFDIDADIVCNNIYSKGYSRDINADDINAMNIDAKDINAWVINAKDIDAKDINAWDINAKDINARDINAMNINAWDINADNINAGNIDAGDISYYAVCFAYGNIVCKSIEGRRENAKHFCLDGAITYKESDKVKITVEGKEVEIRRESAKALNLID